MLRSLEISYFNKRLRLKQTAWLYTLSMFNFNHVVSILGEFENWWQRVVTPLTADKKVCFHWKTTYFRCRPPLNFSSLLPWAAQLLRRQNIYLRNKRIKFSEENERKTLISKNKRDILLVNIDAKLSILWHSPDTEKKNIYFFQNITNKRRGSVKLPQRKKKVM